MIVSGGRGKNCKGGMYRKPQTATPPSRIVPRRGRRRTRTDERDSSFESPTAAPAVLVPDQDVVDPARDVHLPALFPHGMKSDNVHAVGPQRTGYSLSSDEKVQSKVSFAILMSKNVHY